MSNPYFLAVDLSPVAYTWSAGVNASYPVANLSDGYPDTLSKSNTSGNLQNLLIDLGAARACDTIILDGHNFKTLGLTSDELALNVNTNDDTSFADTELEATISVPTNNTVAKTFTQTTKRYHQLYFSAPGSLGAPPAAGNIYLGKRLQFETTQAYGYFHNVPDWSQGTSQSRAVDGRARTTEVFGPIRKFRIEFSRSSLQTDALITSFLSFITTARMRPFYYVDHAGNIYLVKWAKGFNPYKAVHYDKNTIDPLEMESVLAG